MRLLDGFLMRLGRVGAKARGRAAYRLLRTIVVTSSVRRV
jgi:hypothetical protein